MESVMKNLINQPFLLSMRGAVEQTGNFDGYAVQLLEKQFAFKEYLYECYHADIPVQERHECLEDAKYEMCSIRLMCADTIRKHNPGLYQLWTKLVIDTLRFITVSIDKLEFYRKCPKHLFVAPSKTFPMYKWDTERINLSELIVGVYNAEVVKLLDGSLPDFDPFAKSVGNFFGITYNRPQDDLRAVVQRKKSKTPFLLRLIEGINRKN
jgi:hypothetical protein